MLAVPNFEAALPILHSLGKQHCLLGIPSYAHDGLGTALFSVFNKCVTYCTSDMTVLYWAIKPVVAGTAAHRMQAQMHRRFSHDRRSAPILSECMAHKTAKALTESAIERS